MSRKMYDVWNGSLWSVVRNTVPKNETYTHIILKKEKFGNGK